MSIEELIDDFAFLDDWEDRYRYVIDLGKTLAPVADSERNDQTKVKGCMSQVWLVNDSAPDGSDGQPHLVFRGDSDALIVRGLIAILIRIYSDRTPAEIMAIDAREILHRLGLDEHLSPQRSNGLFAMVERIRSDAAAYEERVPASP